MRAKLVPLALLAAAALPLGAQGVSDGSVIVGPQFVSYKFGSGTGARTVSELGIPFAVILPFGDRVAFDISSSYANIQVSSNGSTSSSITGLTDTQLRGNITLGDNVGMLTLGVNLPTGQYKIASGQQEAAGQIGSDFLLYPVSSMGYGLGATGGLAFAVAAGDWNIGFGGSFRHSTAFDAFQVASSTLRFQPGDEARLRVGLDRPVGDGRFALSMTYSKFGNDAANDTTFGTGDRSLAQTSFSMPTSTGDFQISAWNLYRAKGELFSGATSPWEDVLNGSLAVGFNAGSLYIQPMVEGRLWQVGPTVTGESSYQAGTLANLGVRFRFNMGVFSVNPSGGYAFGNLYQQAGGAAQTLTGFKGTLLIRLN